MSFRSRRQVIINEPENELNLNSNSDSNTDEKPSNEDEVKENDIKPVDVYSEKNFSESNSAKKDFFVDVPPKSLYGNNLKKIKSFKKLRRGYKLQNQRAIFINDLKQLLKQFPAENHQYDDELLIEILNIAESFFIYGSSEERENIKTECIEELMKPYFKNDKELLMKTIGHVWQHVNKSNLRRRLWSRFVNFFLQKS